MNNNKPIIYFDMDGTIADFYGVPCWLDYLEKQDTFPYSKARPLINMNSLAKLIHALQQKGYKVGIISWLSKSGTQEFNERTKAVKKKWLNKHLKSVCFDEIHLLNYGTPKSSVVTATNAFLFDDEQRNRLEWESNNFIAFDVKEILKILKNLLKSY